MDFGSNDGSSKNISKNKFGANMANADMESHYTYNESEDISEYDPNRF